MGDFNMAPNNPKLSELIDDHELCTLISELTCFKCINPTCIDNFLINIKTRFMKTLAFETGVSDHHKLIGAILRPTFAKGKGVCVSRSPGPLLGPQPWLCLRPRPPALTPNFYLPTLAPTLCLPQIYFFRLSPGPEFAYILTLYPQFVFTGLGLRLVRTEAVKLIYLQ